MPVSVSCWLGRHHDLCDRLDVCRCGCHREGRRAHHEAIRAAATARATAPRIARPVYDGHGRRVCPGCGVLLVKKNPHGPGRYPNLCPECAKERRRA